MTIQYSSSDNDLSDTRIVVWKIRRLPYKRDGYDEHMTALDTEPPEDVSEEAITALQDSSDTQLRAIIHYAQQLLHDHPPLTEAIEAREGETLVRTKEYEAYTIVVVERSDSAGERRGPFAYRVQWEPDIEGEDGKYRWHYLGKVCNGDRLVSDA